MTTTTIPTATTSVQRPLLKTGARAGAIAALATTSVVIAARASGIPVDVDHESIPLLAFAQMTLVCTAIGIGIAKLVGRRSRFVRVTCALTALSFVPDVLSSTGTAT